MSFLIFIFVVGIEAKVEIPKSIQKRVAEIQSELPGGALTLDYVMSSAIRSSDSFKSIQADAQRAESPALLASSAFDPQLSAEFGLRDSDEEATTSFQPQGQKGWSSKASIRSVLPTGTLMSLNASHDRSELNFSSAPPTKYHFNRASLMISQSLLKDFFGSGSRALLRSGRAGSEALKAAAMMSAETWWVEFSSLFYQAWLNQREVMAAISQLERRAELKRITERRLKRGTSVSADFLQVQSAFLASQNELQNRKLQLMEIWRALVLALYWPEDFLKIDPVIIPVKLDDPIPQALKVCESLSNEDLVLKSAKMRAAAKQAVSQVQMAKYKSALKFWDLQAFAEVSAANSEDKFGSAFSDTISAKNPGWMIGVKLDVPLFSRRERSDSMSADADARKAESSAALAKTELIVRFRNDCELSTARVKMISDQRQALKQQTQREAEVSRRYKIGNSTAFELVQAGDDRSFAETTLNRLEVDSRIAAWRILATSGSLAEKLEKGMNP